MPCFDLTKLENVCAANSLRQTHTKLLSGSCTRRRRVQFAVPLGRQSINGSKEDSLFKEEISSPLKEESFVEKEESTSLFMSNLKTV